VGFVGVVGGDGVGVGVGVGLVGVVGAGEAPEAAVVPLDEVLLEPQPLSARMKEKQANCATAENPCEP
jgi:hypothetical protein